MVASTTEKARLAARTDKGCGLVEGGWPVWAVTKSDEKTISASATSMGFRAHLSCFGTRTVQLLGLNPAGVLAVATEALRTPSTAQSLFLKRVLCAGLCVLCASVAPYVISYL